MGSLPVPLGAAVIRWLTKNAMIAIFPGGDGLPGIADCDLDGFLNHFFRDTVFAIEIGLIAGVLLFHLTPFMTVGVPLPAFMLSARLRDRHADKLVSHPIYLLRQAVFLLKTVAGLCWGAHPTVRALFALAPYPPDPQTVRTT